MDNYIKAKEILDMDAVDFTGAVTIEEIQKAEQKLNVKFPESYKAFLKDFGAGDVGGEVIFGIVNNEREDEDIDMVKITRMEHEYKMPKHMVVIYYDESNDSLCCLDTSKMNNNECPVVSVPNDYEDIEIVADSFGEFLYEMVYDEE